MTRSSAILAAALLVLASALPAAEKGKSREAAARAVFEANKNAAIWVRSVLRVELFGGGKSLDVQSQPMQTLATVLDESGLAVASLSAFEPPSPADGRMANVSGVLVRLATKTDHEQIKFVLPDGTETPARIVHRAPDLDLVFFAPLSKARFAHVTVGATPRLEVLDTLVCLSRLPSLLGEAPLVTLSEVSAIPTKPRTFFVGGRFVGGPVFALDGAFVGVTVTFRAELPLSPVSTVVVLPAEDLKTAAEKARAAAASQPSSQPASAPASAPAKAEKTK